MNRLELLFQELSQKQSQLKDVNRAARSMKKRAQSLSSQPVVKSGEGLADNFLKILPEHLVPGNVGKYTDVAWPYYYTFQFDLGTNPSLTNNLKLRASIQVTQEAAFIFTGLVRHAEEYSESGDLGPLQIEIRDRQSSRFFNNAPIPIQMIGQKGYDSVLPSGFYIPPVAFIDMEMTSWLADGITQNTNGSGFHQFTMLGWRTRVQDAEKVLSTIFGGGVY